MISCIGGYAMLSNFLPTIASGSLGVLLLFGAAAMAVLQLLADVRAGRSLLGSLLQIVVVGLFTYGMITALFWYLANTQLSFDFAPKP